MKRRRIAEEEEEEEEVEEEEVEDQIPDHWMNATPAPEGLTWAQFLEEGVEVEEEAVRSGEVR